MSREHDVVTLSGASWEKYALAEAGKFLRLAAAPGGPR